MKSIGKLITVLAVTGLLSAWPSLSPGWDGRYHYRSHFSYGHHHRGHRPYYGYKRHYIHHRYKYYPYRSHGYGYSYPYSKPYRYYSGRTAYGKGYSYDSGKYGLLSREYGDDRGWYLLRKGRPAEALTVFGKSAQASPSSGVPKIGYALAAAELGQLDRGIWAMRRALHFDPDSLHYVAVGETLAPKLIYLTGRYKASGHYSAKHRDAYFMLAALYYLLGERDTARQEIQRAISAPDRSISSRNLQRLIEEGA